MEKKHWEFSARPPRHQVVADDLALEAYIETDFGSMPITLLNVSRQGVRFSTDAALKYGERVVVCINTNPSNNERLPATIRWRDEDAGHRKVYGCQFDGDLSWETLGELLLRGVLEA